MDFWRTFSTQCTNMHSWYLHYSSKPDSISTKPAFSIYPRPINYRILRAAMLLVLGQSFVFTNSKTIIYCTQHLLCVCIDYTMPVLHTIELVSLLFSIFGPQNQRSQHQISAWKLRILVVWENSFKNGKNTRKWKNIQKSTETACNGLTPNKCL